MKTKLITRSMTAGLATMPSLIPADETPQPSNILEGVSPVTPCNNRALEPDSPRVGNSARYVRGWGAPTSAHPNIVNPRNLFFSEKLFRFMQQTRHRTFPQSLAAWETH